MSIKRFTIHHLRLIACCFDGTHLAARWQKSACLPWYVSRAAMNPWDNRLTLVRYQRARYGEPSNIAMALLKSRQKTLKARPIWHPPARNPGQHQAPRPPPRQGWHTACPQAVCPQRKQSRVVTNQLRYACVRGAPEMRQNPQIYSLITPLARERGRPR